MKILILNLLLIASSFIVNAQTSDKTIGGTHYSIGIDAGIPTGNLNLQYPKLLGGSLQAAIPVASRLFVTVSAGYYNMFGHTYRVSQLAGAPQFTSADVHLLPVKIGLKVFPIAHLYFQGEAGATFLLNKSAYEDDKSVALVYAPQIGLLFTVGNGNFIDAGIRAEQTTAYKPGPFGSNINFVGIRVAYGF